MTRLAIFSDIHSNLPALEALLASIECQGRLDFYWVSGDLAAFRPWPGEILARPRSRLIVGYPLRHPHRSPDRSGPGKSLQHEFSFGADNLRPGDKPPSSPRGFVFLSLKVHVRSGLIL